MKTSGESIASFEFSSAGAGYRALDIITRRDEVQIIEASLHRAKHFLILAQGPADLLKQLRGDVLVVLEAEGQSLVDFEMIQTPHASLLSSAYALAGAPLAEALLVLETETVSALLSASQRLLASHNLNAIEIRLSRQGQTLGIFTGSAEQCAPAAADLRVLFQKQMREGSAQVIEKPTPKFREFFEISG
jgi:hypothetical protein